MYYYDIKITSNIFYTIFVWYNICFYVFSFLIVLHRCQSNIRNVRNKKSGNAWENLLCIKHSMCKFFIVKYVQEKTRRSESPTKSICLYIIIIYTLWCYFIRLFMYLFFFYTFTIHKLSSNNSMLLEERNIIKWVIDT